MKSRELIRHLGEYINNTPRCISRILAEELYYILVNKMMRVYIGCYIFGLIVTTIISAIINSNIVTSLIIYTILTVFVFYLDYRSKKNRWK